MRNCLLLIPGMLVVLTIMSFSNKSVPGKVVVGTYGICDCDDSDYTKFNLTIHDDNTFHYYRNDDPAHATDVKGQWEMKGNTIVLKDYVSDNPIHDKWTFDQNEACLKSRKGFEWTRLCQVEPCK